MRLVSDETCFLRLLSALALAIFCCSAKIVWLAPDFLHGKLLRICSRHQRTEQSKSNQFILCIQSWNISMKFCVVQLCVVCRQLHFKLQIWKKTSINFFRQRDFHLKLWISSLTYVKFLNYFSQLCFFSINLQFFSLNLSQRHKKRQRKTSYILFFVKKIYPHRFFLKIT